MEQLHVVNHYLQYNFHKTQLINSDMEVWIVELLKISIKQNNEFSEMTIISSNVEVFQSYEAMNHESYEAMNFYDYSFYYVI